MIKLVVVDEIMSAKVAVIFPLKMKKEENIVIQNSFKIVMMNHLLQFALDFA